MSFSTAAPRNDYIGNGTTPTYSYSFRIFAATDLKVTVQNSAGVETALSYPSDFSVTGVNNKNGGTITLLNGAVLTGGNLTSGSSLTIRFFETTNQPVDLRNQGGVFLEVIEDLFDRVVRFIQQGEDKINRALHLPETEIPSEAKTLLPTVANRAYKVLAFSATGNPIAATEIGEWEGNWAAGYAYVVRDLVKDSSNSNVYRCLVAHTSTGTTPISSNADAAKWALVVDQAASASSASSSANSAAASANSATASANSATAASNSATTASNSATAASNSATAAANSATAAESALDQFTDTYLGSFAADPTLDNDGQALTTGDLYFNTVSNRVKVYTGSAWEFVIVDTSTVVSKTSSTGSAVLPVGTTAQRDGSPTNGYLRYNTTTSQFEGYSGAWASVGGAEISNDTSTSSTLYPLFASATSGTATTVKTSNAKLLYQPSTGELQSTVLHALNGLVVNAQTISTSYTISANAMSAGPVSVGSGVTITVSSGARWVVV